MKKMCHWILFPTVLIALSSCQSSSPNVAETPAKILPEVRAADGPVGYLKEECLPILNGIIDSLWVARQEFPELAKLEHTHLQDPLAQFYYDYLRDKAVPGPGKKTMDLEPGGCSLTFFLEPFSRSKTATAGLYTTTVSHQRGYPGKEFDSLATRFNYCLELGKPNAKLEKFVHELFQDAISKLTQKDDAFRTRKNAMSQPIAAPLPRDPRTDHSDGER